MYNDTIKIKAIIATLKNIFFIDILFSPLSTNLFKYKLSKIEGIQTKNNRITNKILIEILTTSK